MAGFKQNKIMKRMKNLMVIVMGAALVLMGACDPIEDRDVLTNSYDPNNIQLEVVQSANGTGNGLTLKMNTPGAYGYWDYKLDKAFSDEIYFASPFMGDLTFTYYISTPYLKENGEREYVAKDINVNVQVADVELDQHYYDLVGEDLAGKTWVFDGVGGDNQQWWFMSDPANPWGMWWNAGGTCCPPPDVGGKMVFDVNGAANFTYYANADDEGSVGTWKFNKSFTKLYVGGGNNLLGAASNGSGNADGEYTIVEMSSDRLVLHTNKNGAGTGWTWVFVPEAI